MSECKEYTPRMDHVRNMYARIMKPDGTVALWSRRQKEFDRALAAHDRALREQIAQHMIERAYFHIAWEKGLTIFPTGPDRAKVPPHWVEAATARVAPYLDIIRGEGDAHRPERCPTCGCELAYPTAVHVVDCGEEA